MRLYAGTLLSIGTVLGLLTACGESPAPVATETAVSISNPPALADVYASYVLLASSSDGAPAAYARVIVDESSACPSIAAACGTGTTGTMTARDKPRFDSVKNCPAGGCFPVKVCEATVPFNRKSQICLDGDHIDLPQPTTSPTSILVMGDTGCKSAHDDDGGLCSASSGEQAEPFQSLVKSAGTDFDLILHMGDYNYRGTPGSVPWKGSDGQTTTHYAYDAGDGAQTCEQSPSTPFLSQASSNSLLPDQWDIWRKDFFEPAKDLLAAAPWVFARGNHELCSRAGPGWFYFLDAGFKPAGTQIDCPALPDSDPPLNPFDYTRITPLYQVELDSLNIVVLHSANACDDDVPASGNSFRAEYESQFENLSIPETGTTWIMSHRPFWANRTLQVTSSNGSDTGSYLDGIPLSLAGHQHLFASYTPTEESFPGEVVSGNGGVSLEGDFNTLTEQTVDGETIWVQGAKGHGFLHVHFDGSGNWCGDLRDAAKTLTASCGSDKSPSLCTAPTAPCLQELDATASEGP